MKRTKIWRTGWLVLAGAVVLPASIQAQAASDEAVRHNRRARAEARADRELARQARLLELTDEQRAFLEDTQAQTRSERASHRERMKAIRAEFVATLDETQRARLETVQRLRGEASRQRSRENRRGGDSAWRGRSPRRGVGVDGALPQPTLDEADLEGVEGLFALELTEIEWGEVGLPEPERLPAAADGLFGN